MLTKNDLKAISSIVQIEIDGSLGREIKPVNARLDKIEKQIDPISTRLDGIEWQIKPIRRMATNIRRIKKDLDGFGRMLDLTDVNLHKRVKRIEDWLHLESPKN